MSARQTSRAPSARWVSSLQEYNTPPTWYRYRTSEGATLDPSRGAAWSGEGPPPAIGETVSVYMNMIGPARVVRYFTEGGFLGLLVLPLDPPIWYAEQNGIDTPCHVFGAEIDSEAKPMPKGEGNYRRARVLKRWRTALAKRER